MFTLVEYFGKWNSSPDANSTRQLNARKLIDACTKLMSLALADGVVFHTNPITSSLISGALYGGFRPQSCPIGAAGSSHKEGLAVDLYDPNNEVDDWCMKNVDKLAACGIYIEHPSATPHWSHWSIHPPASGHHVFYP